MIFIYWSRNSRATGPKIRVPRISPWLFSRTTALSSKRIYDPFERRISFLVRTTTALETIPFFTSPDLHIGTIEYKGEWYCFFQKAEPETEEEEDEVVMFRLAGEGEDRQLLALEDEQLMDEVFAEFCHQYEDFEDADEAMELDGYEN